LVLLEAKLIERARTEGEIREKNYATFKKSRFYLGIIESENDQASPNPYLRLSP